MHQAFTGITTAAVLLLSEPNNLMSVVGGYCSLTKTFQLYPNSENPAKANLKNLQALKYLKLFLLTSLKNSF